jgi:LCP family protein required for cell wall assembly
MFGKKKGATEEHLGFERADSNSSKGGLLLDLEVEQPRKKGIFNKKRDLEAQEHIGAKKHRARRYMKLAAIVAVLMVGYMGFRVFATTFAVIERSGQPDALALQDNISPNQLKTEGDGRVNILLIGVGGSGHQAGNLSDVNHILSIDPFNDKVSILGIPRDLYVSIPGHYTTRINAAHAFGEQESTGGGPKLVKETVEQAFGVPIHYYARVDFTGFEKAVDAVDGVDVTTTEDLYDPSYPTRDMRGVEVFQLKAGKHHLDGRTALQVVRCRKGTCGNDFGRAERQQLVMEALKNKALSAGTVSSPSKVSKLLDTAGNHARTDMSLSIMTRLIAIAEKFQEKKVKPKNFVLSTEPGKFLVGQNVGGASVLVPTAGVDNYTQIRAYLRSDLFRDGFLAKENATVTVLNGTLTTGLATTAGSYLDSYGYNVTGVGDGPSKNVSKTTIYKVSDKKTPFTSALLKKRLKAPQTKDALPSGVNAKTDYVVILGSDYKAR